MIVCLIVLLQPSQQMNATLGIIKGKLVIIVQRQVIMNYNRILIYENFYITLIKLLDVSEEVKKKLKSLCTVDLSIIYDFMDFDM